MPIESPAAVTVALRPWPYPYRAGLAVCSDLDETPTADAYFEMVRFLNTAEQTTLGPGVGLEVGNSIYFDMPGGQFSYWNGDESARERIRALIKSGHIDCLHSFGDLAATRAHAGRALDDLVRHGCALTVWVDHAVAPTNFGGDIMRGSGDVEGSAAYHADLTHAYGIRYVWRGRVTSVIGQDVRRRLTGVANPAHPLASGLTLAKETAKGVLSRSGSAKYSPHGANRLMWESALRSGQPTLEFLRSNPSWAGISVHETADGFGAVVGQAMLSTLSERGGACVLYTHLGKIQGPGRTLNEATRSAFERLAAKARSAEILVTTTRRLLDYCRMRHETAWSVTEEQGATTVRVTVPPATVLPGKETAAVEGLSFYVDDAARTCVAVNGTPVTALSRNPPDHTGRPSVSIPWRRLGPVAR